VYNPNSTNEQTMRKLLGLSDDYTFDATDAITRPGQIVDAVATEIPDFTSTLSNLGLPEINTSYNITTEDFTPGSAIHNYDSIMNVLNQVDVSAVLTPFTSFVTKYNLDPGNAIKKLHVDTVVYNEDIEDFKSLYDEYIAWYKSAIERGDDHKKRDMYHAKREEYQSKLTNLYKRIQTNAETLQSTYQSTIDEIQKIALNNRTSNNVLKLSGQTYSISNAASGISFSANVDGSKMTYVYSAKGTDDYLIDDINNSKAIVEYNGKRYDVKLFKENRENVRLTESQEKMAIDLISSTTGRPPKKGDVVLINGVSYIYTMNNTFRAFDSSGKNTFVNDFNTQNTSTTEPRPIAGGRRPSRVLD
jgi:hypothetical protein